MRPLDLLTPVSSYYLFISISVTSHSQLLLYTFCHFPRILESPVFFLFAFTFHSCSFLVSILLLFSYFSVQLFLVTHSPFLFPSLSFWVLPSFVSALPQLFQFLPRSLLDDRYFPSLFSFYSHFHFWFWFYYYPITKETN